MKTTLVTCSLLLAAGLLAGEEPPKGTECGESVLAFYEEGPNFASVMQVYPEHSKYVSELLKQGKVAAAGRMKEGNRALMIVRTKDITEARSWISQDPFVQKGVVKASFVAWGHCWAPGTQAPDFAAGAERD